MSVAPQTTPAGTPSSPLFAMWMWLGGALVSTGASATLFLAALLTAPDAHEVCSQRVSSSVGECLVAVHADHLYVRELSAMASAPAAAAIGCLFVAAVIWLARRP